MLHFFFSSLLWHHFYLICYLDVLSENFQRSGPFFLMLTQSRAYNIQNSWHFYRVDMTLKSIFEFGCLAYCLFSHCTALMMTKLIYYLTHNLPNMFPYGLEKVVYEGYYFCNYITFFIIVISSFQWVLLFSRQNK